MNEFDRAEGKGRVASHRYESITDALTALEPNADVREAFIRGFYAEKVYCHALGIQTLSGADIPLEHLVKAAVELGEIESRLTQDGEI